ncbi:MAG: hypothetical protein WC570_04900, partial [Patescibacteria group bacterium]
VGVTALSMQFLPMAVQAQCDSEVCDDVESSPEPSGGGSDVLLKYLRVTSPNGGEVIGQKADAAIASGANNYLVTWESLSAGVAKVDILYSLDMGDTWQEIVTKNDNAGQFDWKLPNINASPVLLRINAFNDQNITLGSDESNSPFTILNYIVKPQITSDNASEYQFQFVAVNTIQPLENGELVEINAVIKNTGKATWYKNGSYPVHLGTYNPPDRNSSFVYYTWLSDNRPAEMMEDMVVPGEVATFRFTIKADVTPGTYTETFAPVVENLTWMENDVVQWEIQVI